jgi:hypothetical protein
VSSAPRAPHAAGNGLGGPASPSINGERNGVGGEPLAASDAAVLKVIRKRYGPDLPDGKFKTKLGRDRWTRIEAAETDHDAARRLIDEFTADDPEAVAKIRRPFRMAANDRRPPGSSRK